MPGIPGFDSTTGSYKILPGLATIKEGTFVVQPTRGSFADDLEYIVNFQMPKLGTVNG